MSAYSLCTLPARQHGGYKPRVEANAGAARTHTHTRTAQAGRGPKGCGKTGCIFHTETYSVCFSGHGSQDVMYTTGPVFQCVHVFLDHL